MREALDARVEESVETVAALGYEVVKSDCIILFHVYRLIVFVKQFYDSITWLSS